MENGADETQLWEPLKLHAIDDLPHRFVRCLHRFYERVLPVNSPVSLTGHNDEVMVAGRAWAYNRVYSSELYSSLINEHRRDNNFIMFEATHIK
jgi:hypothetical protein